MGAGDSASAKAAQAGVKAKRFERRAQHQAFIAETFAKGAEGERIVGAVLDSLSSKGWRVLHDRTNPVGGNIDHIAVGPPGVVVVDAKNWSDEVKVSGQRLTVPTGDRTE